MADKKQIYLCLAHMSEAGLEQNYLLRPTTETRLIHRWHDEETKTAQVEYDKHAMTMDDDTKYVIKTSLLRNNSVISSITKTNIYDRVLHDQLSFFRHGFELNVGRECAYGRHHGCHERSKRETVG